MSASAAPAGGGRRSLGEQCLDAGERRSLPHEIRLRSGGRGDRRGGEGPGTVTPSRPAWARRRGRPGERPRRTR
ncbi:hypothetical protein, partial [Geodermatophilus obscurus]|uniref:hypothetical protein n=1 Tax=Geodermatophilus obscurus TaxID=1861 RepID=UPI001AD8B93F